MLEILGTIGFDWRVASVNLVSFLIIYFILKKYVFEHIAQLIRNRQQTISEGIRNAHDAQDALERAQSESDMITQTAQQEAYNIVQAAQADAQIVANNAIEDAQAQAQDIINHAHQRGEDEIENMRKELRDSMVDIIINTASQAVQDNLTPDMQKKLVENTLKSL